LNYDGSSKVAVLSADRRVALTAGNDGQVHLTDTATGRPIGPPPPQKNIGAAAFSPDGQTVVTAGAKGAQLWQVSTGRPFGPRLDHPGVVLTVAFSPDGHSVLTGGADGTARIWAARTGQPLGNPMTHTNKVSAAAFSVGGGMVLTATVDGLVQRS
jgi:WD40 repeat protein